jgi:transposase
MEKSAETAPTIEIPLAEYESMQREIARLEQQVKLFLEQMKLLRRRQFGASSEKSGDGCIQLDLFGSSQEAVAPKPEPQYEEFKPHKRKKKRSHKDCLPKGIPIETVDYTLPETERVCPECGEVMNRIGHDYVREEWDLIPAKIVVTHYYETTYACKNCEKNNVITPIIKAQAPKAVIKGGFASPGSVAQIANQKYVMGVPLYRQEQEWLRNDVHLSRQTMSNWLIMACFLWLLPIYDEMKRQLRQFKILHSDGSVMQVLREQGKKPQSESEMWQYRSSSDAPFPIIIYEYQPDKSGKRVKTFLEDFDGYLITDGAPVYHNLPAAIIVVGCWAHVRRKFLDSLKNIPKDKWNDCDEGRGFAYCNELFNLEKQWAELPADERLKLRLKYSKPIIDEFYAWLSTVFATPKSLMGQAIHYAHSQRVYLERFLLDGRLEISNNRAERAFKPFVIGRKNWLFSVTPQGAGANAIYYSILETAKENGLNPYEYLTRVFRDAPNGAPVESLLPWNPIVPHSTALV